MASQIYTHLEPQNVTLFESIVFVDTTSQGSQDEIIWDLGTDLISGLIPLAERRGRLRHTDLDGRICEDSGTDWGHSVTTWGNRESPEADKDKEVFSSRAFRECVAC